MVHYQPMEMGSMDAKVNDHVIPEGGGGQLIFFCLPTGSARLGEQNSAQISSEAKPTLRWSSHALTGTKTARGAEQRKK